MKLAAHPFGFVVVCLAGLTIFGQNEAKADQILNFDGNVFDYTFTHNGNGATLQIISSAVTKINGGALPPADFIPTSFSPIDINAAGNAVLGNVSKVVGPGGADNHGDAVTGVAVFNLNNFTTVDVDPTTIELLGTEVLTGTSSSLDLSFFGAGGAFSFTFNTSGNFQDVLSGNVNSVSGTGSFSQIGQGEGPGPLPGVPEPASIMVWSLILVAGFGGYLYNRRRKIALAQAA